MEGQYKHMSELTLALDKMRAERDMLRDALTDIIRWWDGEDEIIGPIIKAREALEECK